MKTLVPTFKNSLKIAGLAASIAYMFALIVLFLAHPARAATDNGFGDDLSKTGYFTVASYKAFGPDSAGNDMVANASDASPSKLNAIEPAMGDKTSTQAKPAAQ